ncbi:hypothetical protein RR48_09462 [Papilio machaon]|uniref:Uncharacterized protein n=1 Tax=Papilio machaon TaxID=76193 RepID=A0A194RCG3_PAPMA|nr:hypothetical protein RR48_09462 [Papilio machaon]
MADFDKEGAKNEIAESLSLSTSCMQQIGFSFKRPNRFATYYRQKLIFILCVCSICYHLFSEVVIIGLTLFNSPRVEDVVPLLHIVGYGILSIAKVFVLWYKKDVFGQLLDELADIWPMSPLEKEAQNIKNKSLSGLRIAHQWYFWLNISGVWFFNITPIALFFFRTWRGQHAEIGFVWMSWYPFDKQQPVAHVAVYLFEMFAGQEDCEVGTHAYTTGCSHLTPEPTCAEPRPKPRKGRICDYSACYCDPPTVRDTKTMKCVQVHECDHD